jgi:hypothetical protein
MQLLSTPQPFDDAVAWAKGRTLLPTTLDSTGLEKLSADIREVSVFSSEVTHAEVLQLIYNATAKMVAGTSPGPGQYTSPATLVADIQALLDQIGYEPAKGTEGTIKDLRSWKRLELIADVQLRMAAGFGQYKRWVDPTSMLLYPAAEFTRLEWRRVPRGSHTGPGGAIHVDNPRYWHDRWVAAGGQVFAKGRLLALMTDPVWTNVSRFGVPYGPPDFNSGWGRKPITRAQAVSAGLIAKQEPATATAPQSNGGQPAVSTTPKLSEAIKVAVGQFSPGILSSLLQSLGSKWSLDGKGNLGVL